MADAWIPKAPYPESGYQAGFYFAINGIAYVGAGIRNSNEHGVVSGYSYNPLSDRWSNMADYPGNPSIGLCTFAIDSFGYAGLGGDGNGNFFNEMYRYNPTTNSWTQIAPFPATARYSGVSTFVVNGKGYVGAGETTLNGSNTAAYVLGDYYMYDPVTNTWTSAPGLQGPPRFQPTALSFGDSAYLVCGYNQDGHIYYRYVDEFKPVNPNCIASDSNHVTITDTTHISVTDTLFITVNVGIAPNNVVNTLDVYPNPAHNQLNINTGSYASMSGYSLKIINPLGQTVFQNAVSQQLFTINISSWATGVYFMQVLDPTNAVIAIKEIVIQ